MQRPKIRTMNELSDRISVSRPTLSRYFQDPTSVKAATRAKIETLLQGVDYRPNFFAVRMNRKSTGLIGVIIPHLDDPYYASLLGAIEAEARRVDFTVIIQSSNGDPELEVQAMDRLRSMSAEGLIMVPLTRAGASDMINAVDAELPLVLVDSLPFAGFEGVDYVGTNNQQSIGIMVDYLCGSGDAPVYLEMPNLNSNAYHRKTAYNAAMTDLGETPHAIEIRQAPVTWQHEEFGFNVMDRYFSNNEYIDATILCANDRVAIGVIRAAHQHKLFERSGNRLRIAGHDDHPHSRYMTPALTTVAQDVNAIGQTAVRRIVGRLRLDSPTGVQKMLKEAQLRLRESA